MTRLALLRRIDSLTDDELAKVAPFIEADLDAVHDLPDMSDLLEEIRLGQESARTGVPLDHDAVMAMGRARLRAS